MEAVVLFLLMVLVVFSAIAVVFVSRSNPLTGQSTRVPNQPVGALAQPTQIGSVRGQNATPTAKSSSLQPTSDLSGLITTTLVPEVEGMFAFPPDVNPLTGLKVEDISRLERRPVMVKVSNYPRTGRPHAGLSFADIVFEYYIGFGLNRFAAIYLGQDSPQVGPIRSGRLVDAQLGELYQSILVYGNADPTIDEVILAELGPRALAEKDLPTPPRYRIGPVAETNLFTNTAEVTDYVNRKKLVSNDRRDLRGMVFSDLLPPNVQPGEKLGVQFWTTTRGEWIYDPEKGKYLRWIEEPVGTKDIKMIPLIDRLTKEQLAFSNVVILFATYVEYAPTKHDIEIFSNVHGKRAIFFRDGVMVEGKWRTGNNGLPIQFLNSWGAPYHLKPGNTWIVLTGDGSGFAQSDSGMWELRFDLP
jgi:hypothetical protein